MKFFGEGSILQGLEYMEDLKNVLFLVATSEDLLKLEDRKNSSTKVFNLWKNFLCLWFHIFKTFQNWVNCKRPSTYIRSSVRIRPLDHIFVWKPLENISMHGISSYCMFLVKCLKKVFNRWNMFKVFYKCVNFIESSAKGIP